MNKLIPALCLIMLSCYPAYAEDDEIRPYKFPEIRPTLEIGAGFSLVDADGSSRAGEFEYLKDSVTFRAEGIAFPFPHRLHLEADFLNKKDYFGDFSYAYKDIVLTRWLSRTSFHNLENIGLRDLGPDANYTVDVRDGSEPYGIKTGVNVVFARFKTPDFPLHLYIDGRVVDREGTRQQRFLGGSGFFDNLKRTTAKRNVDWHSYDVTAGLNSHLGPVEAEFSHTQKKFNNGGEKLLFDTYAAAAGRDAGVYPHNLIPETEGSTDTLKLHTSYTGRLVASTTLSWDGRENNESGAKADYFTGQGEVTWMPLTKVTVFVKYRHRESDVDNPDVLPAGYLGFAVYNAAAVGIKDSISKTTDSVSGTVRYRAFKGLTLKFRYSFDREDRENAIAWAIDEVMKKNAVSVSANAKPAKAVNLEAKYEHQEIENPAYNTLPNRSDSGVLSVSWAFVKTATAFLSYNLTKEERRDIIYAGMEPSTDANNRDARRDRLSGSLTFFLPLDAALTAGYTYYKSSVEQDLIYNDFAGADQPDREARYKDTAHSYSLNINMSPARRLDVGGGASLTRGKASFTPNLADALTPASIGSFTELETEETEYYVTGGYDFRQGWRAGVRYKYSRFDNVAENAQNPEISDGKAQSIALTVSRRWQ